MILMPEKFDINLDSKALRKLMSVTASGVGAVAAPWLMRAKGKANADVMRIEAQGKKDAEDILEGKKILDSHGNLIEANTASAASLSSSNTDSEVHSRLGYQETKRQNNLENIVKGAAQVIPESVSDDDVDPDWTAKFFTNAQDITSEDLQKYWSKILAGEVTKPGSFSLRTLEILKNISYKEVLLFERICPYLFSDFIPRDVPDFHEKYSISYGDLLKLKEAGLIQLDFGLQKNFSSLAPLNAKFLVLLPIRKTHFLSIEKQDPESVLAIGAYILTASGYEILQGLGHDRMSPDLDFVKDVADTLSKRGYKITHIDAKTGVSTALSG